MYYYCGLFTDIDSISEMERLWKRAVVYFGTLLFYDLQQHTQY
jgi:hypothetical protein